MKKRARKKGVRNVPWSKKKGESRMSAFLRQAAPLTVKDMQQLVQKGWQPVEAAVEAWLTQEAKD